MGEGQGQGGHGPMMGPPLEQLSGDAFDRMFLIQMTMHHAMAVMMARPVAANAPHAELKDLASSIIADQTREMAQMREWLRGWYGVNMPDMVEMMDGMSSGQTPMMPGMPMIPHHEGAIAMAQLAPERAAHQEVKDLAQNVIRSQTAENQQMNAWLAAWYGL